jgi:MarR family transcriptional regulator for hemolysin
MAVSQHDTLGFLVHDVARMLRWHFDRRAQEIGLTRSQCQVLALLWREEGLQQKALAEQMDVTAITLTGLLDRLERDGWVVRKYDPEDRRAKRVFMTPKVEPVMDNIRKLGREVRLQAVKGLNKEEQEQLLELLVRVRSNLADR